MTQELEIIIQENQVKSPEVLQSAFGPLFDDAKKMETEALAIVVTSSEQVDVMAKAKGMRKALQRIRLDAEEKKKELKADILREGRAIDGMNNIIKHLIEPLEKHLEKQEKFIEIENERKMAALKEEREAKLLKCGVDITFINVNQMPEDVFEHFLAKAKSEHEAKMEAEKKAREELLIKQAEEAKKREAIRLENEKLKAEAAEKEKALEIERKKAEEERRKVEADMEAKVAAERAEKERVEAEMAEMERKRKEEEMKQAAALEAKRKEEEAAALAPEKIKLEALAVTILNIPLPQVSSDKAKQIVANTISLLNQASNYIKEQLYEIQNNTD